MPVKAGQARRASHHPGTLYLLHVLTHATRSRLDEALRDLGLTAFHYTVLSLLGQSAGLSSSQLSRRFHVTPQAMGETIAGLEKKALISRQEDPQNRRILILQLSEEGQQLLLDGTNIVRKFETKLFAKRSDQELSQLRDILRSTLADLRTEM